VRAEDGAAKSASNDGESRHLRLEDGRDLTLSWLSSTRPYPTQTTMAKAKGSR